MWWVDFLMGAYAAVLAWSVVTFLRERHARRSARQAKWMLPAPTVDNLPQAEPVALSNAPKINATFNHRGYQFCVRVPDHITTISVPVFVDGELGQYTYRRTDECLPVGDELAVVFTLDGESDHE